MPRPGFVLEVDRSTPPTLVWNGEGLSLQKLPPDRSRGIYAPEPLAALDDIPGPRPRPSAPGGPPKRRVGRHQPAAAADAPPRRPPAGHRGGARPRRRGRG